MKTVLALTPILIAMLCSSCGTSPMASLKKITPQMPEVKRGDIARFSFRDLMPSSIPVVEVDEKKLRKFETGEQKAMAYEKSRPGWGSWFAGRIADFKEPTLPSGSPVEADYGLLPPKPQ